MINNKHGNTHLKKKQTTKKYTMKKYHRSDGF